MLSQCWCVNADYIEMTLGSDVDLASLLLPQYWNNVQISTTNQWCCFNITKWCCFNVTLAPSVNIEIMFRFQPKINGNCIDSTLKRDILSTSLLHHQLMLKLCLKNKIKINGNAIESTLHYDWFYITDAESILKLTKIINDNIVESTLHYDVESTSLLLNQLIN